MKIHFQIAKNMYKTAVKMQLLYNTSDSKYLNLKRIETAATGSTFCMCCRKHFQRLKAYIQSSI